MNPAEIEETRRRVKPGPKKRPSRLVETSVMLDRDQVRQLDALTQTEGKSRSALIRDAVQTFTRKRARG